MPIPSSWKPEGSFINPGLPRNQLGMSGILQSKAYPVSRARKALDEKFPPEEKLTAKQVGHTGIN